MRLQTKGVLTNIRSVYIAEMISGCWKLATNMLYKHRRNIHRTQTARNLWDTNDAQQIVGRERRERVSQLTWCGEGCFDSRGRVNFYEAGSGQEVIRVDWFTLLFKVTRVSQGCGVFFRGLSQRGDEAHSQPRGLPSS